MAQYTLTAYDDFVDFHDGSQRVFTVRNTTQDVDFFYDESSSAALEIDGHKYYINSPSQLDINGYIPMSYSEVQGKLEEIFIHLAAAEPINGIAYNAETGQLTFDAQDYIFEKEPTGEFKVNDGTTDKLSISEQLVQLFTFHNTGDGNVGILTASASDVNTSFRVSAAFDDGAKEATIDGAANNSTSTLTHTADRHVFIGAVILPTSDPGVSGALWNNAGTPAISAG